MRSLEPRQQPAVRDRGRRVNRDGKVRPPLPQRLDRRVHVLQSFDHLARQLLRLCGCIETRLTSPALEERGTEPLLELELDDSPLCSTSAK
jgi:hypothetical protein